MFIGTHKGKQNKANFNYQLIRLLSRHIIFIFVYNLQNDSCQLKWSGQRKKLDKGLVPLPLLTVLQVRSEKKIKEHHGEKHQCNGNF